MLAHDKRQMRLFHRGTGGLSTHRWRKLDSNSRPHSWRLTPGVTVYRLDRANGTLSSVQTTSTLPAGHSERTTCSQIHLTPSGRFLYVGNRAVNGSSIAAFAVDPATGHLTAAGNVPTEAVPSAFCLDPVGHFLFAAGTASGRLASYRINQQSGALTPLAVAEVGQRPAAVLATRLG